MTTFAGLDLFSSGPSHIAITRFGRAFARPRRELNAGNFTEDYAMRELEIEQRGRLIADKAENLAALIETLRYHAERSTTGVLIDHDGVPWPDMTLMDVALEEPIRRGRAFSVRYRVMYLRMGS